MNDLTDADAEELWALLVDARDEHARVKDDADTWDLVAAIEPAIQRLCDDAYAEGHAAGAAAAQVRLIEARRGGAK